MPIKRRKGKQRRTDVSDAILAYLGDQIEEESLSPAERSLVIDEQHFGDQTLSAIWAECRDEIIADYARAQPGRRPARWWRLEAPEPRRRLGGIGTPCHERLAHALRLQFGVPVDWITESNLASFRAIGAPLEVPALDPENPPRYESETAYFKRLGFFQPRERRRLVLADFEPEPLTDIFDFE